MSDIFDDEQNNLPCMQAQEEQTDKETRQEPAGNSGASGMPHDDGMTEPAKKNTGAEKKENRKERREKKQAAKKKRLEEKKQKKNRKDAPERKPERKSHASVGSILLICTGLVIFVLVGSTLIYVENKNAEQYRAEAENLSSQIAANSIVVYTAKTNIKRGDSIVTSGDDANVEKSQIYSSLDPSLYIQDTASGYAQVDIKKGSPVMACEVNDMAPDAELEEAVQKTKDEFNKPAELPYRIYADYVNEKTGERVAATKVLALAPGVNEKAFNLDAEDVEGYKLSSISIDGKAVHAFGISKKELKAGTVTMYYYTGKSGWDRHEIKGNIHVTYGYANQNPASANSAFEETGIQATAETETQNPEDAEADQNALTDSATAE